MCSNKRDLEVYVMLYFLCGAGGSGKDTLANDILNRIPNIIRGVIDTNRPMRDEEIDGVSYNFRDIEYMLEGIKSNLFLEYRKYIVEDEEWYYGTSRELACSNKDYLLWGPYSMYKEIKNSAGNRCRGILIDVPIKQRVQRMLNRVSNDRDIAEACRRAYSDYIDFKDVDKRLFDIIVNNEDGIYDKTLDNIVRFIKI